MVLAGLHSACVLSRTLLGLKQSYPLVQTIRWWRERPVYTRREGFDLKHHVCGPLPRIKATPDLRPVPQKPHKVTNNWSRAKAAFGQNDYIDILGDGVLHPRDLVTEGPRWLRGFRGNEFRRLIRRRNATFHYAPYVAPLKWNNVQKRINYLFNYHNYKQNHKDWRNRE